MASNHDAGGAGRPETALRQDQAVQDAGTSDFTDEEVERRAMETARRVLATPKKPVEPKAQSRRPVVTRGKKPGW